MNKIKLGMIGGGKGSLIGIVHRVAANIGERFSLIGGTFSLEYVDTVELAKELELDLGRVYPTIHDFVNGELNKPKEERIEAVVIATPNHLHYEMAKLLIENGFHVICEKPMTMTAAEAIELHKLVDRHRVVFALTHTYTGYPMVRQMKSLIAAGRIGKIQKVDAQYYQGWINAVIHSKEKRSKVWRLDPKASGISSCFGDIGVHAFNMLEYTTGLRVERVLSDVSTLYDDNPLDVDGTALLRLEGNVSGLIRASQIATGEENNLSIAVYGDKGALKWEQENPNYLYLMSEEQPMQMLKPGHAYNDDFAKISTKLPPGHPEGIFDAMANIYLGAARAIRKESILDGEYPTVEDGVRGMTFIERVIESSKEGNVWKSL